MSKCISTVLIGTIGAMPFVGPVSAQDQWTGPVASSEAFAIHARFTGDHMTTELGPVAATQASAPPAYSKTKAVRSFTGSIAIPPLVPNTIFPIVANFTANASMLRSHVVSSGIKLDSVSASGQSAIAAANLQIANPPGPTGAPPPVPFLTVVAGDVATSANYAKVFPSSVSVSGSASFGSLSISGSLVGNSVITYSGSASKNTVLYQSATITITADEQMVTGTISCPPCQFMPAAIKVHGLDIKLDHALIDGRPVSGDIALGAASAE